MDLEKLNEEIKNIKFTSFTQAEDFFRERGILIVVPYFGKRGRKFVDAEYVFNDGRIWFRNFPIYTHKEIEEGFSLKTEDTDPEEFLDSQIGDENVGKEETKSESGCGD